MIKVRLLVPRATVQGPQEVGLELEVPAATAERMIAAGQAELVRAAPPEKAVRRRKSERAAK